MLLETRIPYRYLIKQTWRDLFSVLVISSAIDLLVSNNKEHVPPIQAAIPAFLGTAITLLISFKLNQSYDRWWEARKIWGAIVNDSRTLARQVLSLPSAQTNISHRIARRQIAWCYCVGQSLRGLDWKEHAAPHLRPEDIAEAERHANKGIALVQMQSRDLALMAEQGLIGEFARVAIDETLTRLVESQGMAERIRSTVFPHTYRILLHGFIYLFITSLAFALAELEGAWAIAITTFIAVPFLVLEKAATDMQDPFANRPTDTAVTTIARTVEINIRELLGDEEIPPPFPPDDFYAR